MQAHLIRTASGFIPASEQDHEAISHIGVGKEVRADIVQERNGKFHRKFFAMLNVGFDAWEPPEKEYRGLPAQKNFERFRKDCVIAAGYYDVVANLKGEVRAEPKSISFARMEEPDFEKVYSAVANVLLQRVLTKYTRADLDRVVEEIIRFTT